MITDTIGAHSAYSASGDSAAAVAEVIAQLEAASREDPHCIIFFAGLKHDGALLGQALQQRFGTSHILGCSGNGEFTNGHAGKGGVAALALHRDMVGLVASAIAKLDGGLQEGIGAAADTLGQQLGVPLRELDPQRFVGVALMEGARGQEELLNEALGNVAPLLAFVGGSAGDNITFTGTWVFAEGQLAQNACALLVLELLQPFAILKTCNFVATPIELTITKADPSRRLVLELDGQPAAQRYAEVIGAPASELAFPHFLANPLGLMIEGEPWLRSVLRRDGNDLYFACAVLEGMTLNLMQATDIVENAQSAFDRLALPPSSRPRTALLFNCAYRMLEVQIKGLEEPYHQALASVTHAGLHTNGESYLGHINQTLTGLVIV